MKALKISQTQKKYQYQYTNTNLPDEYSNCVHTYNIKYPMKTVEQRLLEQEQEINSLRKQNATLQEELSMLDKKSILFDGMIELAQKEYKTYMQKNSNTK